MRQSCEGLKIMHCQDPIICHRDIKIENILLYTKIFKGGPP